MRLPGLQKKKWNKTNWQQSVTDRRSKLWSDIVSLRRWFLLLLNTWIRWGKKKKVTNMWVFGMMWISKVSNFISFLPFHIMLPWTLRQGNNFGLLRLPESEFSSPVIHDQTVMSPGLELREISQRNTKIP